MANGRKSYAELKAIHAKNSQHIKEAEAEARARVGTNGETLTVNVKRRNGKNGKKKRKQKPSLVWGGFLANEVDPKKKGPGLPPEF